MDRESYFWIEADLKQKDRLLLKCFKMKVPIFDTAEDKNSFFLKIKVEDYAKLQKLWFVKTKKKDVTGVLKLKESLFRHRIFLFAVLFGIVALFFLTHIMVEVNVVHSNKEIRDLVFHTLEEKGIKKNTFRKKYKEIEKIKQEILDEYPEKLEWLEIETIGMKYIVRVEERKLEQITQEKKACHLIASQDALVTDMIYSKGEKNVNINDSVKKGDILVRGIIKKEEEVKGVVCASGEVYGEVWYQVSASIPLEYEESVRTGKKRFNVRYRNSYFDDFILKSRIETFEEERHPLFQIFGQEVSFVVQHEVKKEKKTYTEEEAVEIGMEEALAKITSTLEEKEKILDKKVLKKEKNNSTMNIEVFVSVKKRISVVQEFDEKELEETDKKE